MVAGTGSSRDELLTAVRELTTEVKNLRSTLHSDYPKRAEVKAVMRRKTVTYGLTILLVLIMAQVMTITTVSHCFLISAPQVPVGCSIIPGYNDAIKQSEERLKRFYEISGHIEDNRLKIAELELEIEKLKQERQRG